MSKQHILLNAVLFQLAWFSAALVSWKLAVMFVAASIIQLAVAYRGKAIRQGAFVVSAILIGVTMDSAFYQLGFYRFLNQPDSVLGFPLWLLCMWFAFAISLCLSLAWLFAKPLVFVVAAAIMGPVSYVAGRELGLLEFANADVPWMVMAWGTWAALTQLVSSVIGTQTSTPSIQDPA